MIVLTIVGVFVVSQTSDLKPEQTEELESFVNPFEINEIQQSVVGLMSVKQSQLKKNASAIDFGLTTVKQIKKAEKAQEIGEKLEVIGSLIMIAPIPPPTGQIIGGTISLIGGIMDLFGSIYLNSHGE